MIHHENMSFVSKLLLSKSEDIGNTFTIVLCCCLVKNVWEIRVHGFKISEWLLSAIIRMFVFPQNSKSKADGTTWQDIGEVSRS